MSTGHIPPNHPFTDAGVGALAKEYAAPQPAEARTERGERDDYKAWYEEAMIASNEAGFAGVSAAETIRPLSLDRDAARSEGHAAGFADGKIAAASKCREMGAFGCAGQIEALQPKAGGR